MIFTLYYSTLYSKNAQCSGPTRVWRRIGLITDVHTHAHSHGENACLAFVSHVTGGCLIIYVDRVRHLQMKLFQRESEVPGPSEPGCLELPPLRAAGGEHFAHGLALLGHRELLRPLAVACLRFWPPVRWIASPWSKWVSHTHLKLPPVNSGSADSPKPSWQTLVDSETQHRYLRNGDKHGLRSETANVRMRLGHGTWSRLGMGKLLPPPLQRAPKPRPVTP